jgi:hypothetical protein
VAKGCWLLASGLDVMDDEMIFACTVTLWPGHQRHHLPQKEERWCFAAPVQSMSGGLGLGMGRWSGFLCILVKVPPWEVGNGGG